MQNFVFLLVIAPVLSVFVGGALFSDNVRKMETLFLRTLEVASVALFICFALHMSGVVQSTPATVLGAAIWGLAATAGELSRRIETRSTI